MGCLVDTFVLSSKSCWMNRINYPTQDDLQAMLRAVPEKYRVMLRALMVRFQYLDRIMDNRDREMAGVVFEAAEPFETEDVHFADRYRGDCLQQVIRRTFYDTLLIVENDYNEWKYNYMIVLNSNQVITESRWAASPSEEQAFVRKAVGSLVQSGFQVHELHR